MLNSVVNARKFPARIALKKVEFMSTPRRLEDYELFYEELSSRKNVSNNIINDYDSEPKNPYDSSPALSEQQVAQLANDLSEESKPDPKKQS
jgi:hypothetical protein